MNWHLKKISPIENNYELIFGVLVIPITTLFYIALSHLPPQLIPICRFHAITGLPCPTCGATRAMQLLSTGNIIQALLMQPLITTFAILSAIYSLYSFIVTLGHRPRIRPINVTKKDKKYILITTTLIILNWVYLAIMGI